MKYKLLVLDIDGTLTNSKKEITKATLTALTNLQEKGIAVVIASGRPTPGIRHVAKLLNLAKYGNFILSYNGAQIINCKTGEIIYQKVLPQKLIAPIYDAAITHGTGLISYEGNGVISATDIDSYMELEARINDIPIRRVENFVNHVTFPVNKCLMTGEPAHLAIVEQELKHQFQNDLNIYRSEPFFLEIMPQNINKAYSLQKLLDRLGLTKDEMVCCGDGYNDISMIEYAGLGVAMANAQPAVLAAADYITASNDEDGIVQVIRKFFAD